MAVARKTRSGEISSFGGLFEYAPGLDRADDGLPLRPGRHPAARRLVRQVRDVPGRARRRHAGGRRPRRDRRRELGDRALLLRVDRPGDVDEAGARRRPHAGAGPAGARRRARPHRRRHGRHRRPARARRRLRRPRSSATWPPSAADAGGRAPASAARIRRPGPSVRGVARARALRRAAASSPPAAGPAGGATSSPAPRSARCSAPWWPGPSTPGGTSWAGPTRSWWSRRAPAGARWPRPCSAPARLRAGAALRVRRAVAGAAGPAGRAAAARAGRGLRRAAAMTDEAAVGRRRPGRHVARRPARSRWTAWCSPTSCSTTCRSACSSAARTGGSRCGWPRAPTRCSAARPAPADAADGRRGWRPGAPVGGRIPLQHEAGGVAPRRPSRCCERGRVVVVDYADTTPSLAAPARGRVAAHLPRATSGAATRSTTPAARTSPARWPSTSWPRCAARRRPQPRPSGSPPTASTSSWPTARATWHERAAPRRPRGPPGPQPGGRGRGPHRPRRPRRLPRPRVGRR